MVSTTYLASVLLASVLGAVGPGPRNAAATEKGDVGSAGLEGPKVAEVLTHQTWTLVYKAPEGGIEAGGGIRIAMRHVVRWTPPQTKDPKGVGYLTVRAPDGVTAKVVVDYGIGRSRFFRQYFPWQNIVEVTLPKRGLSAGQTLRVTYGDRSGGSPGIRIQPFDEPNFVFKVYVDPRGKGRYLPLAKSPSIQIAAAKPHRLAVVMPSNAVAGRPTWCIVRAEDRYGNPASRYRGTVRLKSSDTSARLPAAYTFTERDRGVHRFEKITFGEDGCRTLAATDGKFNRSGNPVRVTRTGPKELLLWGDLHGHTLHSDGRGTVEQYYDFAERFSGLDFCAVSDHAFEMLDKMWSHSKAVTNRVYKPGRFVTFNAYEWSGSSQVGGDHNLYFVGSDPPLLRSGNYYTPQNLQMYHGPNPPAKHIRDVFAALDKKAYKGKVLAIPHFGGRGGNPKWHHPGVQRLVEIFSEHRRSEAWAAKFLANGHRVGIMASGDGHFGNPGYGYLKPVRNWDSQEIGMGAVAVYAPKRTRESIFRALYERRCYATSGDRIMLDVRADAHPMGSEYRSTSAPTITVDAVGTAAITRLEIKKNGKVVHTAAPGKARVQLKWRDPAFQAGKTCCYYVRILQKNREEAISSPIWVN